MLPPSPRGRGPGGWTWEKTAALCWTVALLIVCTRVVLGPHRHNNYPIYAGAARAWVEGAGLYGRFFAGLDVFRYSPLIAGLFVPLAELPQRLANVFWRLLNAGVLLGGLLWWARAVLPVPLSGAQRGLLCLLVLPLALASLNNGQCNCLILGLVLSAVAAAAEERPALAAAALALAVLWKVYPLAAGLLLAAVYPRRLSGRLALALAVAAGLPFLMQAPAYVAGQYADWLTYLRTDDRQHLPLDFWLRDVRLLFRVWLIPLSAELFAAFQVTGGLACAGLCLAARRRRWPSRHLLTLLTGLACCWMTILGPSVESCTFVLLAPSLAAALLLSKENGKRQKEKHSGQPMALSFFLFPGLLASYGLLLLAHVAGWFPWGKAVTNLGVQPLAALLFLACLLALALGGSGRPAAVPVARQAA